MVRSQASRRLAPVLVFAAIAVLAHVTPAAAWAPTARSAAAPPARATPAPARSRPTGTGPSVLVDARGIGRYLPPVGPPLAVLIGHFRPPPTPYAAGNRGVDYATVAGTPVVASAAGRVIFAGPVAGTLAVTLLHPDGLRTSYSFLATVVVGVGDEVDQGAVIATTGTFFHFGVRDPAGTYLDPEALFAGRLEAHLVPGADDGVPPLGTGPVGLAAEAEALLAEVAERAGARDAHLSALAHELLALTPPVSLTTLALELDAWHRSQQGCTPANVVPTRPAGRRIVVLVAGVGSSDRSASIDEVRTAELGYAAGDVLRFSYNGGRAAGRPLTPGGAAAAIAASRYEPADTGADLRSVADRLVALLGQLAAAAPGVPIDVIAHSQGGVVAHLALVQGAAEGRLPAQLGTVVTISSPHQGADLATGLAALRGTPLGAEALRVTGPTVGLPVDPDATSLAQMSETSDVSDELRRPLPAGTHLLSIGAAGDLVVPWVRTLTPGASSALIDTGGFPTHGDLPGSAAVTREIALALAGRGPTCQSWWEGVADVVTSHQVAQATDELGVGLTLAAQP